MTTADAATALAWSYDTAASRYRDASTGQFVSSQTVTNLRNDFLDTRAQTVADLASQVANGDITLAAWETAMRDEIKLTLGVEYVFGRGGLDQMTPEDFDTLGNFVAGQFGYLNDFAGDIEDGTLSEAEIADRAGMYLGAGVGAYERGAAAASDIDLPIYPGDDCLGMTNCRCSWTFDMAEDGSIEAYWIAEADACEVCADHADEFNPLTE